MSRREINFYSISKDLKTPELRMLISLYAQRKKNIQEADRLSDDEKGMLIVEYEKRIMELKRELARKKSITTRCLDETSESADLEMLVIDVLDKLGYSNNTTYKNEAVELAKRFFRSYEWPRRHGRYSNILLAVCIATNVLDHYLAEYDLFNLLDLFQIELIDFKSLYPLINEWSNYYYWT